MSAELPTNQNMPINVKILMLGLSSVGKTSLLLRFTDHQWLAGQAAVATVGVDTWVAIS
jgi:Ras-related protein Rab-18